MATLDQKQFLERLKSETEEILAFAYMLSEQPTEKLTEQPTPNQWSVAECLEHMNAATELYLDQIEPKMITHLKPSGTTFFKRGFFASYSTKSLKPSAEGKIKSKMKTMKIFQPISEQNVKSVLDRFVNNQHRVLRVLHDLDGKDLRSFKLTTALGKILKFYVGEALEFAIAHNQRHVLQARRVLEQMDNKVFNK
ncbi:hypothetical protein C900_00917 [Fulvivirga imtechensis AK7]|uniref:DinB-like domain-containing protein n=1 Tax=Fulvivirga imtechensis AK7 TaxID=1237149 RepID=L8JV97_9BACT|nr:DinB family protein [Fulvivirga imtechensis]ELR72956.1 hypothetical protein C900_00917 [Fulvivirga imtechensis AK7]